MREDIGSRRKGASWLGSFTRYRRLIFGGSFCRRSPTLRWGWRPMGRGELPKRFHRSRRLRSLLSRQRRHLREDLPRGAGPGGKAWLGRRLQRTSAGALATGRGLTRIHPRLRLEAGPQRHDLRGLTASPALARGTRNSPKTSEIASNPSRTDKGRARARGEPARYRLPSNLSASPRPHR